MSNYRICAHAHNCVNAYACNHTGNLDSKDNKYEEGSKKLNLLDTSMDNSQKGMSNNHVFQILL